MITVTDGQRVHKVQGRVGMMIRFLAEQAQRFNGKSKLRLEFNCAGLVVRPKVEVSEDALRVK